MYGLKALASYRITLKINSGIIAFFTLNIVMEQDIKDIVKLLLVIKAAICILGDIALPKVNLNLLTNTMDFGLRRPKL
jgi:hypothetical protein